MDRIPVDEADGLYELVAGMYSLLFDGDLEPAHIELYDIDSEYVEAEIDLPYIGINREEWETEWSPERRLEVLLHEFAHIEEMDEEPDHGPEFYDRLAELATRAESEQRRVEALLDAELDFTEVYAHIVESVNEYTIETDIESVSTRRRALRTSFGTVRD